LASQGANDNLQQICKVRESNLTEGSCPVKDVRELGKTVDTSKLISSCQKIDLVNECYSLTCQNALSEAARNISLKLGDLSDVPQLSDIDEDCKSIVLRWLPSKLSPSSAKEVIRGLSNCHINKGKQSEHITKFICGKFTLKRPQSLLFLGFFCFTVLL
ncbi:hypothetical protein SOVF_006360, partial [Spinacia oleracea]